MSLEVSVRLSSKVTAIGHPYEDLYERFLEIHQMTLEGMSILRDDISTSAEMAASGDERRRLEILRKTVEDKMRMREKHQPVKLSYHDTSYDAQEADYIFKSNDFVLLLKDVAADDGSLISAGTEGQVLKSYNTGKGNLVYVIKVNNKLVSAMPDNIRIAIRLSTAGEDPAYFDSGTETEGPSQVNPGGTTVRTHFPNINIEKDPDTHVTWRFNPQTSEWDKVFDKVAKLVNAQALPTPASVSPYADRLKQLFIPYLVNPQNEFISRQVGDELSEELTPQQEQIEITQQEEQQVKDRNQQQVPQPTNSTQREYEAKLITADGAGTITSPSNHDRSQIENSDNTALQTNQDIDGDIQTHQIMTRIKDDDDIMEWLPSPSDINEDGNHKTTEGPKFWL